MPRHALKLVAALALAAACPLPLACSGDPGGGSGSGGAASGGSAATGGASASGGAPGSGGRDTATGGAQATGGAPASSGGAPAGTGGAASGGASATGGGTGSGGAATGGAAGGALGSGGRATGGAAGSGAGGAGGGPSATRFSFFVTSFGTMQRLSGSQKGFGGDLRHGQTSGLKGADLICTETAEVSMPGNGKTWRAFLSVSASAPEGAVNAIDRVGTGPWYDRMGRIVAMNKAALTQTRPMGADPAILNDLPNETGLPNHQDGAPGCTGGACPDNHHVLTGASTTGGLYGATSNCQNWASTASTSGRPRVGFSWIAGNRTHWMSGQDEGGCGAGAVLTDMGGSDPSNPIVGSGGGYGAIYCFALTP